MGALPQQETAQALLARGADHQIGVGLPGGIEVLGNVLDVEDFGEFLKMTLAERDQRYRKFGGSPKIGEPKVKESAGGLRDIHTAMWLASTNLGR